MTNALIFLALATFWAAVLGFAGWQGVLLVAVLIGLLFLLLIRLDGGEIQ